MAIKYLNDHPWSDWTRDERFFCAILFEHGRQDPAGFTRWVNDTASLGLPVDGDWDLGYEVCFYRDFLWQKGRSAREEGYPAKRTFDLCAFGEQAIIIIEAKVCEAFKSDQNLEFGADNKKVRELIDREGFEVKTIALASSRYFDNFDKYGDQDAPNVFDGRLTWSQAHEKYSDPLLAQADKMYKLAPGSLIR